MRRGKSKTSKRCAEERGVGQFGGEPLDEARLAPAERPGDEREPGNIVKGEPFSSRFQTPCRFSFALSDLRPTESKSLW